MSKKRRPLPLRLILIFLILVISAVIIFMLKSGLRLENPFFRTEKTVSSAAVLKQVRDISRLSTIEFIHKTVFPYDLIDPETDMQRIIEKYRQGSMLSHKEAEALALYGIAAEAGIDIGGTSFAVVEVLIKAGYNFPETLPADSLVIEETDNSVMVSLPEVEITEIIVSDAHSGTYDYPDLNVSPAKWKVLSAILSDSVSEEALSRGILEKADRRGREFIERFLLGAGFSEVRFND